MGSFPAMASTLGEIVKPDRQLGKPIVLMLGTFRLLLALAVALSHANFRIGSLNPGVIAVICFYLVSGYVMAGLIRQHYQQPGKGGTFYLDRAIRLLPQYLLYASLTLAWHRVTQANSYHLDGAPTSGDLINNLLIVPLNYYMWNGSDRYTLIPPAWSLGAEIQFYLIAPLLLIWPKRLLLTGALSLLIYIVALGGLINSDWYAYRLLPGVLYIFLLGALLQHQHHQKNQQGGVIVVTAVVVLASLSLAILQHYNKLHQPYNAETLLGLIIGISLLHNLASSPRTHWDNLAGDLSYGVFLNHFLILWAIYPQGVGIAQVPIFLLISLGISWLTQRYIEQPLLKWRYKIRIAPLDPVPVDTARK
jgi:peptidoglycan/LPS O-acetylase OafA/YrhL